MDTFKQALITNGFKGDVDDSAEAREFYSHDASMFEIHPALVVFPKDSQDVALLVRLAGDHKKHLPQLSLTARSAGTDMAGGAINDSVIIDFKKYFTAIEQVSAAEAKTQPGVYYRDFDAATQRYGALMPAYPASRDLCTVGGMVA